MKECVQNKKKEIEITYQEFTRGNSQTIAVQQGKKKFRFTFDKRIICDHFTTISYGYVK